MSAVIQLPPPQSQQPLRKRFSRDEVQRMADAGLFAGQRLELIDGDLIDKMGQKPPHAYVIRLVQSLLAALFGPECIQVQLPIEVQEADRESSLPEPDVAVLSEAKSEFQTRYPHGNELLLVVEVADSSVQHDLTTKRDLYARAGVCEYWVLDLRRRVLHVHRELNDGQYATVSVLAETESAALKNGAVKIAIAHMLPERFEL